MDDQRQDVRFGRRSDITAVLDMRQVLACRGEPGLRRAAGRVAARDPAERLCRGERDSRRGGVGRRRGNRALEVGRRRGRALTSAVVQQLLDTDARPKEPGRVGVIQ